MKPPQLGFGFAPEGKMAKRRRNEAARRALRAKWRADGLCAGCGGPRDPGFKRCAKCHGQCRASIAKKYEEYKAKKRAAYIPHPLPRLSPEEKKARLSAKGKAQYRGRIKRGNCGICGAARGTDRTRCDMCRVRSNARLRDWNAKYAARVRNRFLMSNYGLTLIQWEMIFDLQGRICAICGTSEPGKKGWQVDHCHDSGLVRSILCGPCNLGLGCFKDNADLLARAIGYLRKHRLTIVV